MVLYLKEPFSCTEQTDKMTTVLRLRKKREKKLTSQCWFVKADLKTLLQLAVADEHWLVVDYVLLLFSVCSYQQVVKFFLHRQQLFWTSQTGVGTKRKPTHKRQQLTSITSFQKHIIYTQQQYTELIYCSSCHFAERTLRYFV